MKRVLPVLMIIALVLSACGESAALENSLAEARERWAQGDSIGFTAEVITESEQSRFDCTLSVSRRGEEISVEVLSPENLAGIKARLGDGETELEYDGLILAVGNGVGETSPLGAMPLLADALAVGHVRSLWRESDGERSLVVAEVYVSETDYALVWFEEENFAPVHMELVSGANTVVKCKILSFTEE